jgi:hypothetical protein
LEENLSDLYLHFVTVEILILNLKLILRVMNEENNQPRKPLKKAVKRKTVA